jgi:hypothetical protein
MARRTGLGNQQLNPYAAPVSQAEKSLPKKIRFQAVVAPEERRLCHNLTLNQPLTAP